MVDNRSANVYMGAFNFKSGDASSMANAMSDEKMGQGGEYFAQEEQEEETFKQNEFVDRSAQLKGTLDSLSMLNAANIALAKKERDKKLKRDEKESLKKRNKNKKSLGHMIDDFEKK